jgi:hypothetical protein
MRAYLPIFLEVNDTCAQQGEVLQDALSSCCSYTGVLFLNLISSDILCAETFTLDDVDECAANRAYVGGVKYART